MFEGETVSVESQKSSLMSELFEKMVDFRPEPTDSISFEGQYLTDTAKTLLDLNRKIVNFDPSTDDYNLLMAEIDDFGAFVRDPVGYQEAIDAEIERERAEREAEREANRKTPRKVSKSQSPSIIEEGVEEVNSLLEAMI